MRIDIAETDQSLRLLAALRGGVTPVDHPLHLWPVDSPPDAGALAHLAHGVREAVLNGSGWALVSLGAAERLEDSVVQSACWNCVTAVCTPVPQLASGEVLYPVEVSPSASGASHYSRSAAVGDYHTDGSLLPEAPGIAALFCLEAADRGGETVLVDCAAILDDLSADQLAVLSDEHPFYAGDSSGHLVWHPILRDDGRVSVRYLRRYVELGYADLGGTMSSALSDTCDRIDAFAADGHNHLPVRLQRGQILLWDNHRFLHGRRHFTEESHRRRLRRIYAQLRPS